MLAGHLGGLVVIQIISGSAGREGHPRAAAAAAGQHVGRDSLQAGTEFALAGISICQLEAFSESEAWNITR